MAETLTVEEVKQAVRETIREEFELIGIDSTDPDKRAELRKDMEILRVIRLGWDATARKVGNAILLAVLAGLAAIFALGVKTRWGP